jgi:hypothetical protein
MNSKTLGILAVSAVAVVAAMLVASTFTVALADDNRGRGGDGGNGGTNVGGVNSGADDNNNAPISRPGTTRASIAR